MRFPAVECGAFFTSAIVAILFVGTAQAVLSNVDPKTVVPVHHVQLKGTGFDKMALELFEHSKKFCEGIGKTPESIPSGEQVLNIEKDIYYAAAGITTYTHARTYFVDPQSCERKRIEKLEIEMRTAAGNCHIKPDLRRAIGYCDIKPLLASRTEVVRENASIHATKQYKEIAGLKCQIWAGEFGGAHIENCIANTGRFSGMTHSAHRGVPGLLLKSATWVRNDASQKTTDFEATKVTIDTSTTLDVLAPHAAGGYEFVQSGSAK